MLKTWIDTLFGAATTGAKTEITALTLATLNVANKWMCSLGFICLGDDTLNTINTILGALVVVFLGSRLTRIETAATIAASNPPVVVNAGSVPITAAEIPPAPPAV